MLKDAGYRVIRWGAHKVWENDRGDRITTAVSASDHRAWKNIRAQMRRQSKEVANGN